MQTVSHIIRMDGNTDGYDLITTDPHGNLDMFKIVVDSMKNGDRLFICGDLVDRGEKSFELLVYLKALLDSGKPIFCIRGNHEDMVLKTIHALEVIENHADEGLRKRGESLINIFYDSINNNKDLKRENLVKNFLESIRQYSAIPNFPWEELRTISNNVGNNYGEWLQALEKNQRTFVNEFIQSLPYIIYVDNVNEDGCIYTPSFQIVHAAPLADEQLMKTKLSPEEIYYITWARPKGHNGHVFINTSDRTTRSIRTYVGHNVLCANAEEFEHKNILCLDAGTAVLHTMFVANHTLDELYKIENESCDINQDGQVYIDIAFEALKEILDSYLGLYEDTTDKEQSYQDDNTLLFAASASILFPNITTDVDKDKTEKTVDFPENTSINSNMG